MISVQALWIVLILSILVAGLGVRSLTSIELVDRVYQSAQAESLVRSVAQIVQEEIKTSDTVLCNCAGRCFQPIRGLALVVDADTFTVSVQPGFRPSRDSTAVTCDEEARININRAPQFVLANVMGNAWQPEALLAHRSGQTSSLKQDPGAEVPPLDAGGALGATDDLLAIEGFAPEDLASWDSDLTVHGDGRLNLNTCSDAALAATGCPASLIAKLQLVTDRAGRARRDAPEKLLLNAEMLTARIIKEGQSVTTDEANYLKRMLNYRLLGTTSEYFSYHVQCGIANRSGKYSLSRTIFRPADGEDYVRRSGVWN